MHIQMIINKVQIWNPRTFDYYFSGRQGQEMIKQYRGGQKGQFKENHSKSEKFIGKRNPGVSGIGDQKWEGGVQGSTKEIRKLDKEERVVAIHGFIENLASEIEVNNISAIAADVDERYQHKCDEITEKAILQLEQRILKGIDQLNDQGISEAQRSKLLEKVLEQHVLYESLRRERSKGDGGKSKLEETLENKDNDWISKLLKKLGGLAHDETSFVKKGKNSLSHNDLLNQSSLSDSDWKIERRKKVGPHLNKLNPKQRDGPSEVDPTNDGSKTLKLIKKHSTSGESESHSGSSYKQINQKLNLLTAELKEQSLLLKQLMQGRSQQMIQSRGTKKSIEVPEEELPKYKQNRNRVSIEVGEGSQSQLPYGVQKGVQTTQPGKYSHGQNQWNGGYPPQININIRIMPH